MLDIFSQTGFVQRFLQLIVSSCLFKTTIYLCLGLLSFYGIDMYKKLRKTNQRAVNQDAPAQFTWNKYPMQIGLLLYLQSQ